MLLSTVCKYYFLHSHFVFETVYSMTEKTISGVHVSQAVQKH